MFKRPVRELIEVEGDIKLKEFYKMFYGEDSVEFIDYNSTYEKYSCTGKELQNLGVDTIIDAKDGSFIYIDNKARSVQRTSTHTIIELENEYGLQGWAIKHKSLTDYFCFHFHLLNEFVFVDARELKRLIRKNKIELIDYCSKSKGVFKEIDLRNLERIGIAYAYTIEEGKIKELSVER